MCTRILNTGHTVLVGHNTYWYLVTNFGNADASAHIVWCVILFLRVLDGSLDISGPAFRSEMVCYFFVLIKIRKVQLNILLLPQVLDILSVANSDPWR
jgi:hypothetical protein